MTGIAYDPSRSVWVVILNGTVWSLHYSAAAANLALADLEDVGHL